ncbi:hypothetical protein [Motilimonas eburnea]|uniref:hypothetical protein n=1 Tax=Motilimonas eburnea TaxID=1737488 RepID=UPI001E38237F|nr:hypothetical protein [Motilimonas eburnea]MCE2571795.1 hypothetical protein [Motilimonas eburnea]
MNLSVSLLLGLMSSIAVAGYPLDNHRFEPECAKCDQLDKELVIIRHAKCGLELSTKSQADIKFYDPIYIYSIQFLKKNGDENYHHLIDNLYGTVVCENSFLWLKGLKSLES